jgi:hypothetical protein
VWGDRQRIHDLEIEAKPDGDRTAGERGGSEHAVVVPPAPAEPRASCGEREAGNHQKRPAGLEIARREDRPVLRFEKAERGAPPAGFGPDRQEVERVARRARKEDGEAAACEFCGDRRRVDLGRQRPEEENAARGPELRKLEQTLAGALPAQGTLGRRKRREARTKILPQRSFVERYCSFRE